MPYLANNSPAPTVTSPTSSSALIMERSSSPELSCLPKYKRDLVQKLTALHQELQTVLPQSGHCRLEVSREDIFEVIQDAPLAMPVSLVHVFYTTGSVSHSCAAAMGWQTQIFTHTRSPTYSRRLHTLSQLCERVCSTRSHSDAHPH